MNWNFFQGYSLKTKISLATLTIFLLGIWSLSFYTSRVLRMDMEGLLGKQQFSTVDVVATQINREIESRFAALRSIAKNLSRLPYYTETEAQAAIEIHPDLQMLFNGGVIIHDLEGKAVADFPPDTGRRGVNYSDIDVISAAIKAGRSTVGLPVIGKKLQKPVIGMAVPILDAHGKIVGALAGVINLGLPNFLDQMIEQPYGRTGGYLLVVPQNRLVVTATDKNRVMERLPGPGMNTSIDAFVNGKEGSSILVNPLGQEVLVSVKQIPAAGWYAVAYLPTSEAFLPIRDMQHHMLAATLLLSVLAGLVTWLMLRYLLSPLGDTARVLVNMSLADQRPVALPVIRKDEIGQLISGFNSLLEVLGQRESLLKQVLDTSSVAIFLVDNEGYITQANQRMAEMFGTPITEIVGSEYVSLIHPAEREIGRQKMLGLLANQVPLVEIDRLYWRADGTQFWGHLTGRRFYDAEGVERGLIGVIADIDLRKRAEEELQLAASVFTHSREGIMITAADGTIVDINDAFTSITGYMREEVLGKTPRLLKSGRHAPEFYAAMWRDLSRNGHWLGEIWNKRKNGEIYAEMKTVSVVRDAHGQIQHYVALFSDITPLKEHEGQLEKMAHYDAVTGLPNRVLLADRLYQAMVQAQRHKQLLAVVYLDLDGFKIVNDTHGHKTGDQLLMAIAARMKQGLRESDTLARLGGDEFIAVLPDLLDAAASEPMLNRLLAAAAKPIELGDIVVNVSASLGVTFYPQAQEIDADQLLRQADQAMYQAKVSGKNRYHVFDAEQDCHGKKTTTASD